MIQKLVPNEERDSESMESHEEDEEDYAESIESSSQDYVTTNEDETEPYNYGDCEGNDRDIFNLSSLGFNYLNNLNLNLNINLRNSSLWKRMYENNFISKPSFLNYGEETNVRKWRPKFVERTFSLSNFLRKESDKENSNEPVLPTKNENVALGDNAEKIEQTESKNELKFRGNKISNKNEEFNSKLCSYDQMEPSVSPQDENSEGKRYYGEELWSLLGDGDQSIRSISTVSETFDPPINPFFHRIHLNTLEKIKIGIMSVTIAPIRLVSAMACVAVAYLCARIGMMGLTYQESQNKTLSAWRRAFRWFICHVCMRGFFFCAGFHWITIKGKPSSSKEAPVMVAAPHSSFWDSFAFIVLGAPSVVAKSDVRKIPLFGRMIDFTQPVYVSRDDPQSRHNSAKVITARAMQSFHEKEIWPQVYIYPEATCTNRANLIKFKPGGFIPGVPVQPVLIKFPNRIDTITWTFDGISALKSTWLTMCQFHNYMEIEYLPVYYPNDAEKKDAALYANNVRKVMARALGTMVIDYSYDDAVMMTEIDIEKIHEKMERILELRGGSRLQESPKESSMIYENCRNPNYDWKVTFSQFCETLGIESEEPVSVSSQKAKILFLSFHQRGTEDVPQIDLRAYLSLVLCMYSDVSVDLLSNIVYKMYSSGENELSRASFITASQDIFDMSEEKANAVFDGHSCQHKGNQIPPEQFRKKFKRRLEHIRLRALTIWEPGLSYPDRSVYLL